MKDQIQEAWDFVQGTAVMYVGKEQIAPEDMPIVQKYLDAGIVTMAKKKGSLSRDFYFPTIEDSSFEGRSATLWLRMIHEAINQYGIKSGITRNSVAEYLSRAFKYNISPTVLPDSYVGKKVIAEEIEIFEAILTV